MDLKTVAKKLDKTNDLLAEILREMRRSQQERVEPLEKLLGDKDERTGPYAGVTWEELEMMKASERKD